MKYQRVSILYIIFSTIILQGQSISRKSKSSRRKGSGANVFFAVGTSRLNQEQRLRTLIMTWIQLAKKETWIFTDSDNKKFQEMTNHHIVVTNCNSSQGTGRYQCCLTDAELTFYYTKVNRWFCHFNDYNYVNVPRLLQELKKYSHNKPWLLTGRLQFEDKIENKYKNFAFGLVGAGYCMSRALAMTLKPHMRDGKFQKICENRTHSYDRTLKFIMGREGVPITYINGMHGPIEDLSKVENFKDQITLSYTKKNVIRIRGFPRKEDLEDLEDPTRFFSLHCHLFPKTHYCNKMKIIRRYIKARASITKPETLLQQIISLLFV